MAAAFILFETPLGTGGLAWTDHGIRGIELPEPEAARVRQRLRRRFPGVGQALGRNPFPMVVPCHRVIATDGRLGGFSARGGVTTKQRLLAIERANVSWQLSLPS